MAQVISDKQVLVLTGAEFDAVNVLLYALQADSPADLDRVAALVSTLKAGIGRNQIEEIANLWASIHLGRTEDEKVKFPSRW